MNQLTSPAMQQRNMATGYAGALESGVGMDTGNLARAVLAVMKAVQYIEKKGHNDFHNYAYATEADVVAAIRKAMIENDLVMLPRMHFAPTTATVDENGITHIVIEYTLIHTISGERTVLSAIGSGSDKNRNGVGDKGTYKAITGAHKYLLLKTFMVETGDDPERADELEQERRETAGPPPRPPAPPTRPPNDDDDRVLDDPLHDDDDEDDDRERHEDGTERDRDAAPIDSRSAIGQLTKAEAKRLVSELKDPKTPVFKEPQMGDEAGHPWEIVQEIFREFVPLHNDVVELRGFYKLNMPVLQIMEREAPKRKRAVDKYFTTQKNTLAYRDKDAGKDE